jgi:hypothetical protein
VSFSYINTVGTAKATRLGVILVKRRRLEVGPLGERRGEFRIPNGNLSIACDGIQNVGMDSMEKSQAFCVGQDGVFKKISNSNFLQVAKFAPSLDVLSGFFEDNDSP